MKVTLVSEGTYPYSMGGVSTWCDQLIRGLPTLDWEFVALTVDDLQRPQWPAPDNLRGVRNVAMWTPREGSPDRPTGPYLDAYRLWVRALVTPLDDNPLRAEEDRQQFVDALRGLFDDAQRHGGPGDPTSDEAVGVLLEEWQEAGHSPMSLLDALEWSYMVEHLLRPLFAEPVRTDIVHASMNGPCMLVGMAAKWAYGTPVVLSEHGSYLRERYLLREADAACPAAAYLRLNFFRLLTGAGFLISDVIAPHSKYNRRWQLRNGADPERIWTMYNGVATQSFPVAESEPELPTISFLGRIDPIKDVHNLLRSFAIVLDEIPNAQLRIFGGAPPGQEAYLEGCYRLIDDLGISGSAKLEGITRNPVEAYHSGTIIALSSMSEGFPFSVVEAMACGRPVVCTNVGGVAEAVGGAGLMVPPTDPGAFAQACIELLTDHDRRAEMAVLARERVDEWFTVNRWLGAYASVYTETLAAAASPEPRPVRTDPVEVPV